MCNIFSKVIELLKAFWSFSQKLFHRCYMASPARWTSEPSLSEWTDWPHSLTSVVKYGDVNNVESWRNASASDECLWKSWSIKITRANSLMFILFPLVGKNGYNFQGKLGIHTWKIQRALEVWVLEWTWENRWTFWPHVHTHYSITWQRNTLFMRLLLYILGLFVATISSSPLCKHMFWVQVWFSSLELLTVFAFLSPYRVNFFFFLILWAHLGSINYFSVFFQLFTEVQFFSLISPKDVGNLQEHSYFQNLPSHSLSTVLIFLSYEE